MEGFFPCTVADMLKSKFTFVPTVDICSIGNSFLTNLVISFKITFHLFILISFLNGRCEKKI